MSAVAFDTETHLIGPYCKAPKLVCIQTADGDGARTYTGIDAEREARRVLAADLVVGHNVAFDMTVILANYPHLANGVWAAYDENRVRCTQIRADLIAIALDRVKFDPDTGRPADFSLAGVAAKYAGLKLDKGEDTWRLRYGELDGVPVEEWPAEAREYAEGDAAATWATWKALEQQKPADEALQVRADLCLTLMSAWGIVTDRAAVDALGRRLLAERERLAPLLADHGILRREGKGEKAKWVKTTKQAHRLVVEVLGDADDLARFDAGEPLIRQYKLTDTKALCADKEVLAEVADRDPRGQLLLDYSTVADEISDFLPRLRAPIVHARYDVLKATGRTSASQPAMQNLPRRPGVRECFVPRPGCVFLDVDYSSIELCALAEICQLVFGWSTLGQIIRDGRDPHLWVGSMIVGVDYDTAKGLYAEAKRRIKAAIDPLAEPESYLSPEVFAIYDARQIAKVLNFGFPGGLGADSFVSYAKGYGLVIAAARVKELKAIWLAALPEMRDYFRWVDETGPRVIQPVSNRIRGGCSFTVACNTRFQGLASDGAKAAMYLIGRECYRAPGEGVEPSPLYGSRTVAFIHDQFLVECPEAQAERALPRLIELGVQGMSGFIKSVPIKMDGHISRRWSKN